MDPAPVIAIALKLVVVAMSWYPVLRPGSSHFSGKAMGVRAVLYPAVMLLIPATWLMAGRPSPYPYLADVALTVPCLIDAGANVFGLFAIKGFDGTPHFVGWMCLTVTFGLAVAPMVEQRWIAFGLVAGFGAIPGHRVGDRRVRAHAERRARAGPDLREHDPGPGAVAARVHRRRGGGRDRAVAAGRDAGHPIRLELSKPGRARRAWRVPDTGTLAAHREDLHMTDTADVIVIGAGVQGASLAFHLASRGVSVVVVERSSVAAGATGRSSGLVRVYYDLLAESRLAWTSLGWFRDWAGRVGGECGFTRTGFLWIEPAERLERVRANSASHRALGVDSSVVAAEDISRLAPSLDVGDEVAAWEPESGYADPFMTAAGFLAAAKSKGTRLVPGAEVTAIPAAGGRVIGVDTTRGPVHAPVVVNAAGAWAGHVAALAGVDIPVSVWRHDTGYLGVPGSVVRPIPVVIDNANGMYFRPEGPDMVLIGLEDDNQIGGAPDRDTSEAATDFRDRAAERIIRRVPALIDGTFRTSHSGQDGLTPDQRPMLGAAGPDGYFLDCGHSGTGFKTAPAVGLGMSELILDGGATSVDISPFDPGRFAAGRLLVGEHGEELIWR